MKNAKKIFTMNNGLTCDAAAESNDLFRRLQSLDPKRHWPYWACVRAFSVKKALREFIDNIEGCVSQIPVART